MELTPELSELLTAEPPVIRTMELVYPNGGVVRGEIRKLRRSSLRVVIRKESPEKGERPLHRARLDHADCVRLILTDGSVREFGG